MQSNRYLASGDSSWVPSVGIVGWENDRRAHQSSSGETLPSVLFEINGWLAKAKVNGPDFVDPEVGRMARAAVETGLGYEYLRIILPKSTMETYPMND